MKWQLIENKLIKENDIEVKDEDIQELHQTLHAAPDKHGRHGPRR